MKEFSLEIITPSKTAFVGEVTSITVPGVKGEFQVLINHAPLISNLEVGEIKLADSEGKETFYVTSGGVVEVLHNKVLVLANSLEKPQDIDKERAEKAAERAKKRLAEKSKGIDIARAEIALARALNRLKYARI